MGLSDFAFALADVSEAKQLIIEGYEDAISTMESMVGNEGQQTIFETYVIPEFEANLGPIKDGWTDVDIGDYMDFMGDIVGEGNDIMGDAYSEAQDLLSEIEEAIEEFGEGFDLDDL